eukprot:TRINITY_DN12364_c1_g16_i1.p1 TRINITY_DN12364_c1_g16~~TRINITY_DN12364_c1_g16_i1.p1  ORF type:complete len:139 (+),score=2.53 TRINITY_DN12364_c1_g16_i1:243-659(+)
MKMCKSCVKESAPDRGSFVAEKSTYYINFKGCSQCGVKQMLLFQALPADSDDSDFDGGEQRPRSEGPDSDSDSDSNSDDEFRSEEIRHNHICDKCGHIIARHEYTCTYSRNSQYETMVCRLCGRGSSEHAVFPAPTFS